jgi:hypothetical protein
MVENKEVGQNARSAESSPIIEQKLATEAEKLVSHYDHVCSCGYYLPGAKHMVDHYAIAHGNIQPLVEYHEAEIKSAVIIAFEELRTEIVDHRPLLHVSQKDIGFDDALRTMMVIIDKRTAALK